MSLKALIFDVDGTLAKTEEAHRIAFNDSFARFGLNWHWSRARYRKLLGITGGKERMRAYAQHHLHIDPAILPIAEIHLHKTNLYGALIAKGGVPLRPGILPLIEDAKRSGCRLAIATTTNLPNVDRLIRATMGVAAKDVFEVIAAGDMVQNKKPAPDVYTLALKHLDLPASHCVALEDSRNGLKSAQAAGLACVICPSGYSDRDDFAGATAVIDSFERISTVAKISALFVPA